ncbi:condensation domain-containing protein [Streptomyces sp. NBC_01408]|uniref:condensation domain-containing protein n=1 Tax=Streptomyces sp. NBC_01408 TaxID=2903855 RepID=UPI002256C55D|nr:condensation domain-containing protein [Streptomyces sp. NBC_01408]MCX4696873.1 condensation domain-containing protein [Streptomyces sp. NBC_01408]
MARPSRPRPVHGRGGRRAAARRSAVPARPAEPSVPVSRIPSGPLLEALAGRGGGRHVEQLSWRWRGPLDTGRFTAAWQSVVDRETVLRAAVHREPEPRVVLHEHAAAEVVRHPAGTVDWDELLERDRLRGFDLRSPGPLRVTLVDDPAEGTGPGALPGPAAGATRVLVTFHHGLLDAWSVFVLLDEFYRAYLAGGTLSGGERRPDIRDWAGWLDGQDTGPAREFWSRAVPEGEPAVLPALPGPDTLESGCGRAEARLSAAEADRLHRWAAAQAVPDSSALQAVWALLLYRAAEVSGPALVGFGVTVSGRGIALDAVERLPGPMRNCLPMAVRVDPGHPLGRLLTTLRDRALDMAPYEWVTAGQIHEWTGRATDGRLLESLVAVESTPRAPAELKAQLAADGIRVDPLRASGAHTVFPVALLAHGGSDGTLTLAAVHDRARISAADARRLVGHCARLLRALPATGEATTVAQVLALLAGEEPPRIAARRRPPAGGGGGDGLSRPATGGRPVVERITSES